MRLSPIPATELTRTVQDSSFTVFQSNSGGIAPIGDSIILLSGRTRTQPATIAVKRNNARKFSSVNFVFIIYYILINGTKLYIIYLMHNNERYLQDISEANPATVLSIIKSFVNNILENNSIEVLRQIFIKIEKFFRLEKNINKDIHI
jgi:hypothetical protein